MGKRILVLNERDMHNPLAGGAEVHLFEVFGRLAARGHDVTLLAASFPGCEPEVEIDGIRVRRLVNRYAFYALAPFVARRMARAQRVDLVVDVLAKLPFLSPWFISSPCVPIAHHLFGTTAFQQVSFPIALITYLSEKLIPFAYRRCAVVAVSPSTREDLIARGLDARHISVVPNGIDHDLYSVLDTPRQEEPLLLWLGRVEPYKRLDLFLQAVVHVREKIPGIRAVIVGDGTAMADVRGLVARLGLDCVELAGFVPSDRKVELLRQAQALVNTSEKEGWGLTVLEGNACGAITVASDVPGLRDSVRDGRTGLLVKHGDVDQLSEVLIRVLSDHALRTELREGALEWASRFTWDAVADDMEGIIEAVAAGHSPETVRMTSSVFRDSSEPRV